MIQEKSIESLKTFLASAKENFCSFIDSVDLDACKQAAELIIASQANGGRIHVTGIGKPGHVAAYAACCFLPLAIQQPSSTVLRQYMDHADSLLQET